MRRAGTWGRKAASGLLLACLAAGGAAVPGLRAQEPGDVRIGIEYRPGFLPALAMTPVRPGSGLAAAAARADSILRRDLDYSDRFEILPVPDSLRAGSAVNYGLWGQLGVVFLVTADVSGTASAPLLRVALHDVVYSQLRNVQAFVLPAPDAPEFRMAVHRVADAVVEWATGEPGAAATRIAFRRQVGDGRSEVFAVDSDGENLTRLTSENAHVYTPSFSPDGRRLLYQMLHEDGTTSIVERDLRTGGRRTVAGPAERAITPAYAPDGGIAYARWTGSAYEIVVSGRGAIVRATGGDALNPSFAPDGRRLAFEATPLGQQQIYVQAVGSGPPALISRYVRSERGSAAGPDWSPRGDRIAYSVWTDGAFQIATVNPDGTERRVLTSTGRNEDPSWAPDGRHIVFASTTRQGRGLVVLDTVTGRTRTLLSGQVDAVPAWSDRIPEGR